MNRRRALAIIAHRGASCEAPESTCAAILAAQAAGAEMIELDAQLTADDRVVIFHDDRLDRTTDGRGWLRQATYPQLARLDAGRWFAPRFANERVLLASQALRIVRPPCRVNLELKPSSRGARLVQRVLQCLRWTRMAHRVLISSFDWSLLRRVQRARPQLAKGLLCRQEPTRSLRAAIRLRCVAFHPHRSLVSPTLVDEAHAAGLRVHVWTIDRLSEARRLAAWGVDGVFTNNPRHLRVFR